MPELIDLNRSPRKAPPGRLRNLRAVVVPAWVLSTLMFAASAPAAEPGDATSSEDALIDRGVALREARSDAAALETFRKAYELKQGARALAQVALAEQALGRWVEAEVDLTQALGRRDDPWIARNKGLLNQALAEIQDHLGSLQVSGGVSGAELFLDDVRAGKLPLARPLRVNVGVVSLQVRAAGYLPYTRVLNIPRQGLVQEMVVLVPAAASSPSPPSPAVSIGGEARGWPVRTKVGLALSAGAVVSAAVGTTFLLVRDGRARTFNDAGCGTEALTPDCSSLRDKEETAKAVSVVGLMGAVVLGGLGAYLLVWPSRPDPNRVAEVERPARAGMLRCAPSPGAGMSVTCVGRF